MHFLVPKHEVLSEEEVKLLLEKYNTTKDKLPKIYQADKGLKDLKVKVGDVIKITRKSPTAGSAVYYRVVVEGEIPKIKQRKKEEEIFIEEEDEGGEEDGGLD